ncbi:hypothetical protein LX32DRAFT_418083 [Colletotrichum zoysiae]|uniref:Uncharacterized protein n=1 Tax=Colletotrichum zoysiae TaxID=1216348 RepID=A0AAD9M5P6_9PEZI|nr:hypothetical protein LX32DRAFT_418083 [Colletotrichum zoysiae]
MVHRSTRCCVPCGLFRRGPGPASAGYATQSEDSLHLGACTLERMGGAANIPDGRDTNRRAMQFSVYRLPICMYSICTSSLRQPPQTLSPMRRCNRIVPMLFRVDNISELERNVLYAATCCLRSNPPIQDDLEIPSSSLSCCATRSPRQPVRPLDMTE